MTQLRKIPVGSLFQYNEYVCMKSNAKESCHGSFYTYSVVLSKGNLLGRDLRLLDTFYVTPLKEFLVK